MIDNVDLLNSPFVVHTTGSYTDPKTIYTERDIEIIFHIVDGHLQIMLAAYNTESHAFDCESRTFNLDNQQWADFVRTIRITINQYELGYRSMILPETPSEKEAFSRFDIFIGNTGTAKVIPRDLKYIVELSSKKGVFKICLSFDDLHDFISYADKLSI